MTRWIWRTLAIVAIAIVMGRSAARAAHRSAQPRHVFIIMLENEGYDRTFGAHADPHSYLAHALRDQGELLSNYYAIGHFSLDNYIALISGQAPNVETQEDCSWFNEFSERDTSRPLDSTGQFVGNGCVYPPKVRTLANQLAAEGLTWRAYMEDMKNPCEHPAKNARDPYFRAQGKYEQYATRHNPFVYFHAIIDDAAACQQHVVPLSQLDEDLRSIGTTPNFVFITPNLCDDGHDGPGPFCEGGHLMSAERFLRAWVPKILAAPAYRQDGMLIITFDEADTNDDTSCCNEPAGPNVTQPGMAGPGDRSGGGHIGTLIISSYVHPGSTDARPYNHYSLLRGLEDIFGLKEHLGYAQTATSFDTVLSAKP
jgi:phosphatidylinositol-3-phosphatase